MVESLGHPKVVQDQTIESIYRKNVRLDSGEQIVFEVDQAVLTNRRVLANWKGPDGGSPSVDLLLDEILDFEKLNGGHESRVQLGVQLIAGGLALLAANLILHRLAPGGLPGLVDSLLFIAEAVALIYGTYIVMLSFVNPKPRTTILFTDLDAKNFAITFPGWDNSKAQEFTVRLDRARQDL